MTNCDCTVFSKRLTILGHQVLLQACMNNARFVPEVQADYQWVFNLFSVFLGLFGLFLRCRRLGAARNLRPARIRNQRQEQLPALPVPVQLPVAQPMQPLVIESDHSYENEVGEHEQVEFSAHQEHEQE